jgi:hypothetical protein
MIRFRFAALASLLVVTASGCVHATMPGSLPATDFPIGTYEVRIESLRDDDRKRMYTGWLVLSGHTLPRATARRIREGANIENGIDPRRANACFRLVGAGAYPPTIADAGIAIWGRHQGTDTLQVRLYGVIDYFYYFNLVVGPDGELSGFAPDPVFRLASDASREPDRLSALRIGDPTPAMCVARPQEAG